MRLVFRHVDQPIKEDFSRRTTSLRSGDHMETSVEKLPSRRDSRVRSPDYANCYSVRDKRKSQYTAEQSKLRNTAAPTCMETLKEMVSDGYLYDNARGVTDGYSILWSCREGCGYFVTLA
ncbi:hypothetical protein ARMGADRAFT_1079568 [Armillaria gallica]|uniref:Uncharacterized protein n=1 Tax=Armillaria gallica TaxID=47427 RepID=A0A2H3DTD7_ARMGA|nr:hypothetical protein ARMGADRAFT_1079568 [Armillaria gallica]